MTPALGAALSSRSGKAVRHAARALASAPLATLLALGLTAGG
jgi:hypothetical protein